MTHSPEQPQDPQDALFEITPKLGHQGGGYEISMNMDHPSDRIESDETSETLAAVTDIRERGKFLLSAMNNLAEASRLQGLEKGRRTSDRERIDHSMGAHAVGKAQGGKYKKEQEMIRARATFLSAYNLGREQPAKVTDEEFDADYKSFTQLVGVGANPGETLRKRKNRDAFRAVLNKIIVIEDPSEQ